MDETIYYLIIVTEDFFGIERLTIVSIVFFVLDMDGRTEIVRDAVKSLIGIG